MRLFLPDGFLSIVACKGEENGPTLLVRARAAGISRSAAEIFDSTLSLARWSQAVLLLFVGIKPIGGSWQINSDVTRCGSLTGPIQSGPRVLVNGRVG